ncbi:MAG TPA: hypothetical protein ACFYEE_08665 [Candidatus Wujingus californicus]|uniref:hypothetical protein n=1 Tax=Candidatus Wujingus californicus TaxID=3367618 RepID=UPI001DD8028E|nr:hypothetical protein [Planctomycetota bacterium]
MKRQKNNCLVLETFKKSVRNIGISTEPYGIMRQDKKSSVEREDDRIILKLGKGYELLFDMNK